MTSDILLQAVVDFTNCNHWDLTIISNVQEVFWQVMGAQHKTIFYLFLPHVKFNRPQQ